MRRTTGVRAAAATVAMASVLLACGASEPTFLGRDRITIAHKKDQPGTSYKPGYDYSGFDYKVGLEVVEKLGVRASRPIDVPSDQRVPAVVGNEADLVIATFSITAARMKKIDFVGPYAVTYQGFMVGPKGGGIDSVDDLKGLAVCTWTGTTSVKVLEREAYGEIDVRQEPNADGCLDGIRDGRYAAVSTDQMILYGLAGHNPEDKFRVLPKVRVGPPQYYGIGMPKGHREDCERLREIVKKYTQSSEWADDFKLSLELIPEKELNWESLFRPNVSTINANSCTDAPNS